MMIEFDVVARSKMKNVLNGMRVLGVDSWNRTPRMLIYGWEYNCKTDENELLVGFNTEKKITKHKVYDSVRNGYYFIHKRKRYYLADFNASNVDEVENVVKV